MIRLKHFSCGYQGHPVLTEVNLDIQPNEITVVIGRNGSGKSTLAQALAGLKLDFKGEVWIDELQLKRSTPIRKLRQKVGLVLQNPDHQILFTNVRDEINFVLQNLKLPEIISLPKDKHRRQQIVQTEREKLIQSTLERVGLADKIDANPQELSGGQKQRLALASVLVSRPEYLILDEATSMLDLPSRRAIYQTLGELKRQGMGVIMMTNLLDEILLADTVLILDNGKIYQYPPNELIRDEQILAEHGLEVPIPLRLAKKLKANSLQELRERL